MCSKTYGRIGSSLACARSKRADRRATGHWRGWLCFAASRTGDQMANGAGTRVWPYRRLRCFSSISTFERLPMGLGNDPARVYKASVCLCVCIPRAGPVPPPCTQALFYGRECDRERERESKSKGPSVARVGDAEKLDNGQALTTAERFPRRVAAVGSAATAVHTTRQLTFGESIQGVAASATAMAATANGAYSRAAESAMMLKTFIRLSARCCRHRLYICVNAKPTYSRLYATLEWQCHAAATATADDATTAAAGTAPHCRCSFRPRAR
ncbi:unnamed protein product [Trichogramma brassicae]|uniref:Uncharacterized protein n=1 Tax=Trichogramma brassicae TaxID=86971 RepID=A0A6H5I930_9HYME|nr:unnamed protein product [Trichogramma brassicae]